MSPSLHILLTLRSRVMLDKLRRFAKGDNRYPALVSHISLKPRPRVMLERLRRFANGDNRD